MIAITAPFWTLELLHDKLDVIFAPKNAPKTAPKNVMKMVVGWQPHACGS